jgi:hypothetical protein
MWGIEASKRISESLRNGFPNAHTAGTGLLEPKAATEPLQKILFPPNSFVSFNQQVFRTRRSAIFLRPFFNFKRFIHYGQTGQIED